MPNVKTKDGIEILGVPQEVLDNPVLGKQMVESLRASSGAGTYNYADVVKGQARPTETAGTALTPEQRAQIEPPEPTTTVGGMLGGIAREAGPTSIAALAWLPIAAAERVTHAITPYIADFVNEKLGLKGTPYEQMSSQEMYDYLADKLGIAKPKTAAEQQVAAGARGAAEALGALGGGQLLQATVPTATTGITRVVGGEGLVPQPGVLEEAAPTLISRVGQVLAESPLQQFVGGTLAGVGAEKFAQIAEEKEMGRIGQFLMPLAGGLIGDITGTGLVGLGDSVWKLMQTKNMDMPEAAAEAIRLSQGRGEVFLSDIEPTTARGERGRSLREAMPGGTQDLRYARNQLRKQQVYDVMDDFGVVEGDYYARDLMDDFLNKRGELLSKWKGEKDEVIERLSRGGLDVGEIPPESAVDVSNTLQLIDSKRAELAALGDQTLNPLINSLTNWEGALSNKNLSQIEFLRKRLRNTFEDPSLAAVKDDGERVAREIYNSLNEEMGNYIRNNGSEADFNKWSMANSALKDMMKDFEVPALAKMINEGKGDASSILNSVFSDDVERVRKLYNRLSPDGRERTRTAIMAKMAKDATDLGDLSPNQFARQIDQMGPSHDVFFREQDGAQLEGLRKWLEFTKRDEFPVTAAQPGAGVPGGQYALARGLWSDPRIGIPLALAGRAGAGKFTQWLERGDVRDTMIKLAAIPDTAATGVREETFKRLAEMYRAYMGAAEEREAVSRSPRTRRVREEE